MTSLSPDRARQIADIMDSYEQQLRDANDGKRDTWQGVREELRELGLKGAEISADIAELKGPIARRFLENTQPEKARTKAERADGAEAYYAMIAVPSRVHVREGLNSEPTADWSTGTIIPSKTGQIPTPGAGDEGEDAAALELPAVHSTPEPNSGAPHAVAEEAPTGPQRVEAPHPIPQPVGLDTSSCGTRFRPDDTAPRAEASGLSWSYGSRGPDRQQAPAVPDMICASSGPQETHTAPEFDEQSSCANAVAQAQGFGIGRASSPKPRTSAPVSNPAAVDPGDPSPIAEWQRDFSDFPEMPDFLRRTG